MEDDADLGPLLPAIHNEYFVLQGASSSSIAEASSRASLYLLTLSSGLVSLGFVVGLAPTVFTAFAAASLTTIFVLGWFTVFRLIDTSIANVRALRAMAHIRSFYGTLHPRAHEFFETTGNEAADATKMLAIRRTSSSLYGTMASMIGAVNGVVGGAGAAMLLSIVLPDWAAVAVGIVVAAALFGAVMVFQRRRFASEFPRRTATTDHPSQ